jgi:hypothetical protein
MMTASGGAGGTEMRKGFLVLETNYKVYAYTCECASRRVVAVCDKTGYADTDALGDSQRAGDCYSEPIHRYSDEVPEPDRREIGEGHRQGCYEERDYRYAGELFRLRKND